MFRNILKRPVLGIVISVLIVFLGVPVDSAASYFTVPPNCANRRRGLYFLPRCQCRCAYQVDNDTTGSGH